MGGVAANDALTVLALAVLALDMADGAIISRIRCTVGMSIALRFLTLVGRAVLHMATLVTDAEPIVP